MGGDFRSPVCACGIRSVCSIVGVGRKIEGSGSLEFDDD